MIVIIQNDGSQAQLTKGDAGRSCSGRGLEVEALGQVKVETLGQVKVEAFGGRRWLFRHSLGSTASCPGWHLCIHLVTTGGTRALYT